MTILQIDAKGLDESLAYPDEDWLKADWDSGLPDYSPRKQLSYTKFHRDLWQESLAEGRTLAYRGIIKPDLLSIANVPGLEGIIDEKRMEWQWRIAHTELVRKEMEKDRLVARDAPTWASSLEVR